MLQVQVRPGLALVVRQDRVVRELLLAHETPAFLDLNQLVVADVVDELVFVLVFKDLARLVEVLLEALEPMPFFVDQHFLQDVAFGLSMGSGSLQVLQLLLVQLLASLGPDLRAVSVVVDLLLDDSAI